MKILLSLLALLGYLELHGQLSLQTSHIIYSYDAAGNRVQRKRVWISDVAPMEPEGPLAEPARLGPNASNSLPSVADAELDSDPSGFQNPKGLNPIQAPTLHIYPNPTTGVFTVQMQSVETHDNAPLRVNIYDMNGALLLQSPCGSTPTTLDIGHLPAGTYQVSVSGGEYYGQGKIVKGN